MCTDSFKRVTVMHSKLIADDVERCHILIVDDNTTNRFVLKALLKKHSYNSIEAKDGKDAVTIIEKYVKAKSVDELMLIFMDLQMPNMNGIQATKEIINLCTADGITPPPIIGVSSDPSEEDRAKFFNAGIQEFISKPIDRQKISYIIDKYINK